jgi:hypothetical protein
MNKLKIICLTIILLLKQAWSLPQAYLTAFKQKRQPVVRNEHEKERLDRLRNPSNYRGR